MEKQLKAFVLMPFDPEFNSIFSDLIKPALEAAGYAVARADSFLDQQNILREIIQGIASADLIVADLTTLNANVFYELGLCHGLKIPTILLAQSIDEVPFDLRSYRVQVYETRFDKVHKLKEVLTEIGLRHKEKEINFGSPIIDFLPRQEIAPEESMNVVGSGNGDAAIDPAEEIEEKGFLDFLVEGEAAMQVMNEILSEFTEANANLSRKLNSHTEHIKTLSQNPGPGVARQFHRVSLLAASDMNHFSKRVEDKLPDWEKAIERMTENYSSYIKWVEPASEETREQIAGFRSTISSLLTATQEAEDSIRSQKDSVEGIKGISKDVNRASRRQVQALAGVLSNMEQVEAFCIKILNVIDEKLSGNFEADSDQNEN